MSIMKSAAKILAIVGLAFGLAACDNVPAGNVGVKVERYGDERGVNVETLTPGRYWSGPNTDIFLFPTFTQTHTWEGADSFTFQTSKGMKFTTAIGVSYFIKPENAPKVFQKYRRGVDEITQVYLRTMIRDALSNEGSKIGAEEAYGPGREKLQNDVLTVVKGVATEVGIEVERVYFVGELVPPPDMITAINKKIQADQLADQKEAEVRGAQADAAKVVAEAEGKAEAIEKLGKALRTNPEVLKQQLIEKWDGKLPVYQAGNGTGNIINLPDVK